MSTDLCNVFSCWYPLCDSWGALTTMTSYKAIGAPGEYRLLVKQAHMSAVIHMGGGVKMASYNILNMPITIKSE